MMAAMLLRSEHVRHYLLVLYIEPLVQNLHVVYREINHILYDVLVCVFCVQLLDLSKYLWKNSYDLLHGLDTTIMEHRVCELGWLYWVGMHKYGVAGNL